MDSSTITIPSFIAREKELSQLSQFLERACTGEGQVVFVRGVCGSGKTTLVHEFIRRTMATLDNMIVATTHCLEHVGPTDPYRPFTRILHALLAHPHAGATVARALVEQGPDLLDLYIPSELVFKYAQNTASRNTTWYSQLEERTRQTRIADMQTRVQEIELSDQIAHTLQAIASRYPIILAIDDLQWADSASTSLLFYLGKELSETKILIIGIYDDDEVAGGRDGKPHPLTSVLQEWQRDQHTADIDLNKTDGTRFLAGCLEQIPNRLEPDFRDALSVHTRGHPTFMLELLRDWHERGILVKNESGEWISTLGFRDIPIAANVHAVIAERLARLPDLMQTALAIACIQGQEFSVTTIAEAIEIQAIAMIDHLDALEKQFGIVRALDNGWYQFQNACLKKTLYQNIDPIKRARMHQAVGQALEKNYHGQSDTSDVAAQLAWHFEQAAQANQSARYTLYAGRQANRFSAYTEAIVLFHRGLQWLSVLPQSSERDEKELELRLAMHIPLVEARGYSSADVRQSMERLQEICDQVGEIAVVIPVLLYLADFYHLRSELDAGNKVAQRALDMAQRIDDAGLITWARQCLAFNSLLRGELAQSRQQWEQSMTLENMLTPLSLSIRQIDARVASRTFNAIVYWLLGYADKATQLAQEAIRIGETLNHPASLATAWSIGGGLLDIFRQNFQTLPERVTTVLQLTNKYELALEQASTTIFHGQLLAHQGRVQDGIQMMYRGLAARQAAGVIASESLYMGLLAAVYNAAGRPKPAQHALSEAIMSVRETGERFWEAELYRQVGEALMQNEPQTQPSRGLFQAFTSRVRRPSWDNVELDELLNLPWDDPRRPSAEYCFERAIQVAEKQQAKSLELRATISLCRLWIRQDKRRQAQQKLSALYKWFSEGFDTQDLRDAKSLLNS